jgi:cholest-4-en-3-one 26-monooxygenase
MEGGTGFFAVTRHEDVSAVSKNSKDFSTSENGAIIRFKEDMLREMVEFQRVMLINQDPPEHTLTRQIVSRGFTPRAIAALDEKMKSRAHQIVTEAVARGKGNFVEEVSCELPLQAIADLLGVPQEDRDEFASVLWRRSAGVGSTGEGTSEHGPLG